MQQRRRRKGWHGSLMCFAVFFLSFFPQLKTLHTKIQPQGENIIYMAQLLAKLGHFLTDNCKTNSSAAEWRHFGGLRNSISSFLINICCSMEPSKSHAGDQFIALCLQCLILLNFPLHIVRMGFRMVCPALLLEEIPDFRNVVLNQHLAMVTGCTSLQRDEFIKTAV